MHEARATDEMEAVMRHFVATLETQTALGLGSDEYIRNMLTSALGEDKAGGVIDRILLGRNSKGLEQLKWMDPRAIAELIRLEHPQIIAIVLSFLDPDQAAGVLSQFSERMRTDVIMRVATLDGIESMIVSDHILNLFEEVRGRLPDAKPDILAVLDRFLALDPKDQCLFQVGRRLGIFTRMADLVSPKRRDKVDAFCRQYGIGPENVDQMIDEIMKRFI